jgi:hypothetical protein
MDVLSMNWFNRMTYRQKHDFWKVIIVFAIGATLVLLTPVVFHAFSSC